MSPRVGRGCRCLLALGMGGLLGASPRPPAFERALEGLGPGRASVVLDREVYEAARPDLGDLRVFDETGAAVPYVLDCAPMVVTAETRRPAFLNRTYLRGRSSAVTLDFGARVRKRELALSLSGDNFRRRVQVEGSDDGKRWDVLTDTAYVFAVPGPSPARYETVPLPENDLPRLRVTVFTGPDDPERIDIQDVTVRSSARRQREVDWPIVPAVAEDDKARETLLTLDLGARHQPFHALTLDVAEPQFFRGVVVETRRDPPPPRRRQSPAPIQWVPLGEGALYRYPAEGRTRENLRLEVAGRERVLRLRIRNRDDRPLTVRGVKVSSPVERLVFEAGAGRRYRLTYGSADLPAPQYDLARTVSDPQEWSAGAQEARMAEPIRRPQSAAFVPWTERHPVLIWIGLVAVVALLGLVTWRALQSAG